MSKIEELIKNEKVEWKKLGDIAIISGAGVDEKIKADEKPVVLLNYMDVYRNLYLNKSIPSMEVTASDIKINECDVRHGDIFITPSSETKEDIFISSVVKENIENTVYSYHIMRMRLKEKNFTTSCFLNYVFRSQNFRKNMFKKVFGNTRQTIAKSEIEKLEVPIPSLETQEKIVKILDKFTNYVTELKARNKQYEYYLRTLVSIDTHDDIVTLNEVIKKATSGSTPKKGNSDYYNNATVPWIRTQDVCFNEITSVDSYISEVAVKETSAKPIPVNCVIVAISGATAGRCAINKIEAATNQHCLNLQIDEKIALYKYVFYCVYGGYERLIGMKQGARGDLNSSLIKSLEIYLPSLEEQQRIVDVLDRFDSLCNDLSNGLPAEIEARQKQYEYYVKSF